MKIKDLEELKEWVERIQQQKHRAEGRLQETQERLKREFQVSSLRAAEKLLEKLEAEEGTALEDFEIALRKFNEEWGDKLE